MLFAVAELLVFLLPTAPVSFTKFLRAAVLFSAFLCIIINCVIKLIYIFSLWFSFLYLDICTVYFIVLYTIRPPSDGREVFCFARVLCLLTIDNLRPSAHSGDMAEVYQSFNARLNTHRATLNSRRRRILNVCVMCMSVTDVNPPRNFEGEVRSANSIQLTWTEPLSESGGDRIESYELYYNDTHFRQNVRVSISPTYSSYLLSDLTPATVYHLRLAARTSRGEGPSTDMIQLQTLDYG